jgi:hypothetical protein
VTVSWEAQIPRCGQAQSGFRERTKVQKFKNLVKNALFLKNIMLFLRKSGIADENSWLIY